MRGSAPATGSKGYVLHVTWYADPEKASLRVRGCNAEGKAQWYNCGSDEGECPVPWGNIVSNVEFKAQALMRPTVVHVSY